MAHKRKRIAAFGEVMMRLEVPGHALLSQENMLKYSFSGTGVNVAAALTRFGHTGYLISALPDNALGDAALAHIHKLGIHSNYIQRSGRFIGMYFLENGYGVRPSRVTYSNRQESSFNTAPVDTYDPASIASDVDAIHFCGITLAMNDSVREQMKQLAHEAKRQNRWVVFDCNYRPSLWGKDGYRSAKKHYEEMLTLADIVMMNEQDALHILGMPTTKTDRLEQLKELIPEVAKHYDIPVIAGTQREVHDHHTHSLQGYIYKAGHFAFSKRLTFAVYDRIGAGDAFTSGILHGELQGDTPGDTVAFAAASAMLAHTVPGDTPMSAEEDIRRAMRQTTRDIER